MTNKQSKFLSLFLLCSFVLQISTLSPPVHVPYQVFGTIGKITPNEVYLLPKTVYQVTFSDFTDNSKDTLIFTGDIMLARNVEYLIQKNNPQFPFQNIDLKSLGERPAIIGNFESAIPVTHEFTPPFAMRFSVNPDYLDALHEAGFTHVTLANNHSFDYGSDGYTNAVTMLSQHGITTFGNGRELDSSSVTYIDTDGGRVALIGINASQSFPDFYALERTFAVASRQSDYQIAVIHWGTEYETVHTKTQELIAKSLVADGADLIIGHHPHVTEDVGLVDGVVVFYSIGNFIFDQYFSTEVEHGLVLSLDMRNAPAVRLLPVTSEEYHSQPTLMDREAEKAFLQNLAIRSAPELAPDIETGLIPLSSMVASSRKNAIMVR